MLKVILPKESTLPVDTYTAKTQIKSLGMDYEVIHACRIDCILYWKKQATREFCPVCKASRWKSLVLRNKGNKIPWKVLRYFPLTPRLKRLYTIPWIAKKMWWHANAVGDEEYMRHPVDSSTWKSVNRKWPEFSGEPRNVRLGLATDGFNPFGMNNNNSYSCWPVMIVPYNLPPSYCMTREFTMLTLLIHGKTSSRDDIDMYLQPLVEELTELWRVGSLSYSAYTKKTFTMKAIFLWVIHDFPAYGHLADCRTGGKYACPVCSVQTDSIRLLHGKKEAYMATKRFLPKDHVFRSQNLQFNGKEEHRTRPNRLVGSKVLERVETFPTVYGKLSKKRKRPTHDDENGSYAWSKKSILFDLAYWKSSLRKHCDKYDTIQERKRNRKSGVKKGEWDMFVDMESIEHACLCLERGKENRKMMKNPHTTGRRGSARTVEILIQINEIVARDPSSKYKDLDHDPIAEVFGKDGRGRVLGSGSGVSKTTIMVVASYKRKTEEAERSKLELQSQMDYLKNEVIEGKRIQMEMQPQVNALLTMQGINQGVQMRISTNSTSD